MDPLMAALIFGFLGICVVWTLAQNYVRRRMEQGGPDRGDRGDRTPSGRDDDTIDPAETARVYRKIFWLRVLGLVLCLAGIAVLYMRWHSGFALLLAGAACLLQYISYRLRTAHMTKHKLVPSRDRRR